DRPTSAREVVQVLTQIEQRGVSRRRWLMLAGGAGLAAATGLVAGLLAHRRAAPGPVEVTLELDEPATPLLLVHGDRVQPLELTQRLSLDLQPGDYLLRLADRKEKRQL